MPVRGQRHTTFCFRDALTAQTCKTTQIFRCDIFIWMYMSVNLEFCSRLLTCFLSYHQTYHFQTGSDVSPPPPGTCLSGGGGGGGPGEGGRGSRGEPPPPPPAGTYPIHREQKNYWRMNNSAHGNVMLSAVNKGNSSLNVNSGFPHLTNTQQLQQSGTFTVSCQMTSIFLVSQN